MSRLATADMSAAVSAAAARGPGHYAALGVARDAPAAEVRRAYRRAALALHPDKNCAPGAADEFRRAARAFEVLGDERRRREYDVLALFGDEGGAEEAVPAWDQAAFDAAPVRVKAMAAGILVVALVVRLVLAALGWVLYGALTVVRWALQAVVIVVAVVVVLGEKAWDGAVWAASGAVVGGRLMLEVAAVAVLEGARRVCLAFGPRIRPRDVRAVGGNLRAEVVRETPKKRRVLKRMRSRGKR